MIQEILAMQLNRLPVGIAPGSLSPLLHCTEERVSDGLGGLGFPGGFAQLCLPQIEEAGDNDCGLLLSQCRSGIGVLAVNLILDLP